MGYDSCSGTKVVPEAGGLIQGMDYYARVFAFNSIGYSLPQSADFPQKPMVVPSAPSSVTLERVSSTELQVIFNQPSDNGGDYITEYIVEWDTSPDFNTNMQSAKVTYLAGGAPFFKTISGLTTGVYYYVRVAAYNSQGYGAYQTSTPAALNPATKPSLPTNVQLGVTSDSLLTVSFDEPLNNGGDTISNYLIEWDVSASFNSVSTLPNKGSVTISASSDSSYTIQLLTANTKYYARVSAINSVGYGIPQLASPNYASFEASARETSHNFGIYWSFSRRNRCCMATSKSTPSWYSMLRNYNSSCRLSSCFRRYTTSFGWRLSDYRI